MIPVDAAQIWTVIGVLTAGLFGMLTLMSTMFLRVLRTEIGGLRGEISGLRGEMRGEIGGLRGEIAGLRNELNARIDGLDRDIQFLMKREADRS